MYPLSPLLLKDFIFDNVLESFKFDNRFKNSKRCTAYFGTNPYSYSGMVHVPVPIESNCYMYKAYKIISDLFPDVNLNSILVNFYPSNAAFLPYHSDDEPAIVTDSYIITLSIGDPRNIVFRKIGQHTEIYRLTLEQSLLLIFSKNSQFSYEHSIPPCVEPGCGKGRISLTFRNII